MAKVRDESGNWRNAGIPYVKVDGVWRQIQKSWSKVDGSYKLSTLGSPPPAPTLVRHAAGQFRISNYDASLTYTVQYVAGDASGASISSNILSIASGNSTYRVLAAYLPGGNTSQSLAAERKAYTYYTVVQCYWVDTSYDRDDSYNATCTTVSDPIVGDTSNCAPYPCSGTLAGPQDNNACLCIECFRNLCNATVVGGGLCPAGGWYVCNGNRCCFPRQTTTCTCPNGGTVSGTRCLKYTRITQGYWASCQVKNPTPSGYTDSEGEWWRIY